VKSYLDERRKEEVWNTFTPEKSRAAAFELNKLANKTPCKGKREINDNRVKTGRKWRVGGNINSPHEGKWLKK